MNKNFKAGAQGGFTLIELIVVIVILGILAATALPKFINLGTDARVASVSAAKGALSTGAAIVHGKYLMGSTSATSVTVDGASIALTQGYPSAAAIETAAGLDRNDYKITVATGTAPLTTKVTPISATEGTCTATYTEASSSTNSSGVVTVTAPSVVIDTSNCG